MTGHHYDLPTVTARIRALYSGDPDNPDAPEPDDLDAVMLRAADLLDTAQAFADAYGRIYDHDWRPTPWPAPSPSPTTPNASSTSPSNAPW